MTDRDEQRARRSRACFVCGQPITACMGFVLARDFVAGALQPREFCGQCVLFEPEREWFSVSLGLGEFEE